MITIVTISAVALLVLFAFWNGNVINWDTSDEMRAQFSKKWHTLGFYLRILMVVIPIIVAFPDWDKIWRIACLTIPFAHVIYNAIINIKIGNKWYYLGDSRIDRFILKTGHYPLIISAEIIMLILVIVL